VSKLDSQ